MKKMIALALTILCLVVCAVLLCSLAACSGGDEGKSVDFSVQEAMTDLLAAAPIDDPLTLTEGDMLDFYGIQGEDMSEFAATMCSNGISAQEIVLVKAVSEDSAKTVEEKLQNRLENRKSELKDYLPDQYEIVSNCQVVRDGVYVRLIISPEEEQLVEIYQGYVEGK
jgi:hypothetical protein